MKPLDKIWACIESKENQEGLDLDTEIEAMFGDPEDVMKVFNSKFNGRYSSEHVEAIVKAGLKRLTIERSLTEVAMVNCKYSFSEIANNSIFGDGSLSKKAAEQKIILTERHRCLQEACEALEEIDKKIKKSNSKVEAQKIGKLWWN